MLTKLLIRLDGLSLTEEAIRRAAAIASNARMELVLLPEPHPAGVEQPVWTEKRMARGKRERARHRGRAGVRPEHPNAFAVVSGAPASAFRDRARAGSVDIIMMSVAWANPVEHDMDRQRRRQGAPRG